MLIEGGLVETDNQPCSSPKVKSQLMTRPKLPGSRFGSLATGIIDAQLP